MDTGEKLEEIAKVQKYIGAVEAELANVGLIPRTMKFHKFDTVAMALVSKAFSIARACIVLLEANFEDEAYGLSRTLVECGWTLRFLTQDAERIEERTWKYISFMIADKQHWMYHAFITAKDEQTKADIRQVAKELDLHDDPTEVESHWSGNHGFAWHVNQGEHPLDNPAASKTAKSAEYAVEYHQTSSYVHVLAPAIDNFLPEPETAFKVKLADGEGGNPSQRTLFILATYLHACMGYMFFGLGLDRPQRLNELFGELLNEQLRPYIPQARRREKKENPLEDLPQLQPWLTWTELTGAPRDSPGKREALATLIRKYPRENILRACATISVLFSFGPEANTTADKELTTGWIPRLFPPALVDSVNAHVAAKRVIFFQAQIRFLASEVIRTRPDPAQIVAPLLPNEVIGELLLRSAELLYRPYSKQRDQMDELANKAALFLPYYEIDSQHDPAALFIRAYIYLTVIIPTLPPNLCTFDIPATFDAHYGFPLTEYCEFVFLFLTHAMTVRQKKTLSAALESGLHVGVFRNTTIPHASIERMFRAVSFTCDEINALPPEVGFADFDFLRDRPYFRLADQLFCLDYEFAVNKIESAVIWGMLRKLASDGERKEFLGFWGHVFEYYVGWLFQTYATPAFNTVYLAPKYVDDPSREICDVAVICGRTAVLIEAKLATCPSRTRYAGNYGKMRRFLEEKLVEGVGVDQLVSAIANITADPKKSSEHAPEIPEWLSKIDTIMPVIVTRDDVGSSWSVNAYLYNRFIQKIFGKKRHKKVEIAPLLSISVGTLEKLMGTLSKMSLDIVLEDRIKRNPTLLWPFDAASKYTHRGMPSNTPKHMEILQGITDKVIKDFGITDPPAAV